jgi:ABC-type transport system substrate-binding protein
MKSIASHWLAGISLAALALAAPLDAARPPRYGGTLRVEMSRSASVDPRSWRAGTEEAAAGARLAALLFDRLVELDDYGRIQPRLAVAWTHDPAFLRWRFTIRAGVKFSAGTPLTATEAALALRPLLAASRQLSVEGDALVIQSAVPMPDLLLELAAPPYFICRALPGGALAGTGPFLPGAPPAAAGASGAAANSSDATSRMIFRANPDAWSGRPYVDAVEVTFGVPAQRQFYDLQTGLADIVELTPDLALRAAQGGLRTWTSAPLTLYALLFDESLPAAADPRLREAFSLSLDRASMAGVLLQKQAEPASTLLPQWLSGYAFLVALETNMDRARQLRAALPANFASSAEPLRLFVSASGDLARLLADRVALDARQAGLQVKVLNRAGVPGATFSATPAPDSTAELRMVTWRYSSLLAGAELDSLAAGLGISHADAAAGANSAQLFGIERRMLGERAAVPLVVLPESTGLAARVHDWRPARWGEWRLAEAWLDAPEPPSPLSGKPAGAQP